MHEPRRSRRARRKNQCGFVFFVACVVHFCGGALAGTLLNMSRTIRQSPFGIRL